VEKLSIAWELKDKSVSLFKSFKQSQSMNPVPSEKSNKNVMEKIEEIVFTQCVPKVLSNELSCLNSFNSVLFL
jgi:hypothetical protein